jgi:exosortase
MENQKSNQALIWSDRWRLGALSKTELINIALVSVLIGMLFLMFHLLGNTVSNVNSRSAFVWMIARWNDKISFGADYSHGYLIPFVSLWIVWYKRDEFFKATKQMSKVGLYVIILALLMHWVGAKMQQTRLSLMSLILLIWGIPFYFFGWKVAKLLIFPCAYLIFCVPLNFLDALSFPLQKTATAISYNILNATGLSCEKVGTQLMSPYFQLNVEAPCSGLRSLLAMTALTAVYAYFTQPTLLKKWILFILSIPLAVAGNIGRIISIAVVSTVSGQKLGTGLYHDWSGYVLFTIAISLMVLVGKLLNINYREFYTKWKKAYLNPS